jgi:hypothetical protein
VFSGDNGGATTRGVNGDRILVSVRLFEFPSFAGADEGPLAAFMFKKKQLEATISGLFDYFNTRFQPYGRRLEPVFWEGKGDIAAEAQGPGPALPVPRCDSVLSRLHPNSSIGYNVQESALRS